MSESLLPQETLQIKCGNSDLALFRDADGHVRALLDQCAHRRAPLSLGTVTAEGLIECPYHGWRYNGANGQCVAIPNLASTERVPRTYRVPAFAVDERGGFIHVWSGGDGEPHVRSSQLDFCQLGNNVYGSRLLAYPYWAVSDLLLDAPDAVLEIPGVAIVNAHRMGDPAIAGDRIEVAYAAIPARARGKRLVSEYPMRVRISMALDGSTARVTLTDDVDNAIAVSVVGLMPVRDTLCSLNWRGSVCEGAEGKKPMAIGIRQLIDPLTARDAVDYVSRLRRLK